MNTIAHWEEVPLFDNEEAEAMFWAESRPELRLMETAVAGSGESSESVAISLRIDPRMLARIKRLARARFLNYQSMIKQWLSERMESEMSNENQSMKNQNRSRQLGGFTLIELLVVISIIGLLAAMVVGLGTVVAKKSKITRVQGEMAQLKTAIESYKAKKGFYPPDNTTPFAAFQVNTNQPNFHFPIHCFNALYYELVGAMRLPPNPPITNNVTLDGQDFVSTSDLDHYGIGGIANLSMTPDKSSDNFNAENFLKNLKPAQTRTITNPPPPGQNYVLKVFVVPVKSVDAGNPELNLWHYVSSNPTNNPDSYDLWAEVLIGGKTTIIGNWSDNPIVK